VSADGRAAAPRQAGPVGPILSALAFAVIAVMPPFLIGAFSVSIRADVGFGPGALGGAIGLFFIVSSVLSVSGGGTVERFGPRLSLAVGATLSSIALATIASAPRYAVLLIGMVIGGVSNALTQPAVGALLSQRIPTGRLGLAFGTKQAGIPGATLLGGLLVPVAATGLGWRTSLGLLAGLALAAAVAALLGEESGHVGARRRMSVRGMGELRSLVILTLGGALGAAAATSSGTFLVGASVAAGFTEASAGLLLAAGSLVGLSVRVLLGHLADLRPTRSRYGAIAVLMLISIPGFLLLTIPARGAYMLGAVVVFVFGWSWAGLFQYAVVSQNPATPALATGVLQTGMSLGAGSGPLLFGLFVQFSGYPAAWTMAATLTALSALTVQIGRVHLRRTRERQSSAYLEQLGGDLAASDVELTVQGQGVALRSFQTSDLEVMLIQLDPGAHYLAPVPTRTGTLLNLGGHDVELELNGERQLCAGGMSRTVPAYRPWRVANPGPGTVRVAHVGHVISGS